MKNILLLAFIFLFKVLSAQTTVKLNGNVYESVKKEGTRGGSQSINTGKTFEWLPVMQSKNGLLYVVKTSKKTNKQYKQYLKIN